MIKQVQEAEAVIARIKGKKSEEELIEEQKDLMEDEPEAKCLTEYHHYCHTMDLHSSGSFVYTGIGYGYDKNRTTMVRFSERKKK